MKIIKNGNQELAKKKERGMSVRFICPRCRCEFETVWITDSVIISMQCSEDRATIVRQAYCPCCQNSVQLTEEEVYNP